MGGEHGHWYGGGESLVSEWPLDQGSISMEPFVTGDEDQTMWGNVIRKFFINSRGLSIRIADSSPLSVSLNDNSGARERAGALCLEASFNQFPYYYHRYELPVLNYTVCTGGNIKDVYSSQMTRSFWNDHRDSDMTVLKRLLKLPLWQVPGVLGEGETYSLEMIQDYIWSLSGRSRMSGPPSSMPSVERGYLLLDYHWQRHMGDLTFDRASFPNITGLKAAVRAAGLKLAITVNPFVSVESDNFKQGVRDKLFVIERNSTSDKFIPALTWFKVNVNISNNIYINPQFRTFLSPPCSISPTRTRLNGSSPSSRNCERRRAMTWCSTWTQATHFTPRTTSPSPGP